jgi:cysteine desulfurase / selenocysteine lyase
MEQDLVYLNNAATSFPKPASVLEAVTRAMSSIPSEPGRGTGGNEDPVADCRRVLASFFGVDDPRRVILTSGATESLNLLIMGTGLESGHVVTTSAEHNSVLRPLARLESEGRISLTIVACDGEGRVSAEVIRSALRDNTRAIVVTHCSNVTGAVNDLQALGDMARDEGLLLFVDASQSAGCIEIALQESTIDALVFTGHKALFGPPGTGGVVLRRGLRIAPLKVGGTGVRSESLAQPEEWPLLFEAGTPNVPGIAGLSAGVRFVKERGLGALARLRAEAGLRIVNGLRSIPGATVYTGGSAWVPVTSFTLKNADPEDVAYILFHSFGIVARPGLHCAPLIHRNLGSFPRGSVRVSPSPFTTEQEVDRFLNAVDLLASRRDCPQ